MKRILLLTFAAAMLLLASCQKEAGITGSGDTVNASFRIALPEQVVSKAISDGTQATELIFRVFDKNDNLLSDLNQTVTVSGYHATINVQLVKGVTYDFTFWAQTPGKYTVADDGTVTVTPADMMNGEPYDAFYARINDYLVTAPFNENVTLYRPFAQLNVGAPKDDFKAAASSAIDTLATAMKTAYTLTVPNKLNLLDGTVSGAAEVAFTATNRPAEFLTVDGTEYSYVAMAYILADVEKDLLPSVKFNILTTQNGEELVLDREVANVPYQRNYRTNILGNIFSVSGIFNITVDPIYNEPDYNVELISITPISDGLGVDNNGAYHVTNNTGFQTALATVEEGATVYLADGTYSGPLYNDDEGYAPWARITKDLTIEAENKGGATIDGVVTIENRKVLNLNGLVFSNDTKKLVYTNPSGSSPNHVTNHKQRASSLNSYTGEFHATDCDFYATTADPAVFVYTSPEVSTFENCNFFNEKTDDHRPIMSYGPLTIKGCSFYKPSRYVVQLYGTGTGLTYTALNNKIECPNGDGDPVTTLFSIGSGNAKITGCTFVIDGNTDLDGNAQDFLFTYKNASYYGVGENTFQKEDGTAFADPFVAQ